jgi:polysaccharide export outer membrane protein
VKFSGKLAAIVALSLSACSTLSSTDLITTGPRFQAISATEEYKLGVGDELKVQVYGESTITGDYIVSPEGSIMLPLIGKLMARGKSVPELTSEAMRLYGTGFLREPSVSMQVSKYRPIYILGEVGKPGQYPFSPGMTVQSAMATAEGYAPRANKKIVFIRSEDGLDEAAYQVTPMLRVYPGDTIRVGERYF